MCTAAPFASDVSRRYCFVSVTDETNIIREITKSFSYILQIQLNPVSERLNVGASNTRVRLQGYKCLFFSQFAATSPNFFFLWRLPNFVEVYCLLANLPFIITAQRHVYKSRDLASRSKNEINKITILSPFMGINRHIRDTFLPTGFPVTRIGHATVMHQLQSPALLQHRSATDPPLRFFSVLIRFSANPFPGLVSHRN